MLRIGSSNQLQPILNAKQTRIQPIFKGDHTPKIQYSETMKQRNYSFALILSLSSLTSHVYHEMMQFKYFFPHTGS